MPDNGWDRADDPLPAYLTGKNYPFVTPVRREIPRVFPRDSLDEDAVRTVQRLARHGHLAYFVGGCVRDLLVQRKPKDFDVVTTARPRQVKKLFRNCWIIGRRFKLAHVNVGSKTIEVSTFRAFLPETFDQDRDDLLIRRDNLFGTPEEDACRRDFTINGLFYDLHCQVILDHVGGMEDVENRIIRTIGDPEIRFREDPVRILRAIKFASRLTFAIEPSTYEAMVRHASDIQRCAAPRVLEEIFRIFRGGAAVKAFRLMRRSDVLRVLFPEIDARLEDDPVVLERLGRHLEALDALVARGQEPSAALCLASLFLPVAEGRERVEPSRWDQLTDELEDMLYAFCPRWNVSRRDAGRLRDIIALQRRLRPAGIKRRQTRASIVRHPGFPDAIELFRATAEGEPSFTEDVEMWEQLLRERQEPGPRSRSQTLAGPNGDAGGEGLEGNQGHPSGRSRPRRRRRRRGSRSRGGRTSS